MINQASFLSRTLFASVILLGPDGATRNPASQAVKTATRSQVDNIIAKYIEARGGYKKLKAIKTLRMTGAYQEGNSSFSTYILWKRPALRLVVAGPEGMAYLEGYNGTSWEYSQRRKQLKVTSGAAEAATRRGAEFDESIIDYMAKGHAVTYLGRETILGIEVFHLRVNINDGWVKDYYLDAKTCLIAALRKAMPLHAQGSDIESLTIYGDYRPVADVLYPHSFVEKKVATGEVMNTLKWDHIEANIDIDNSRFDPPAPTQN